MHLDCFTPTILFTWHRLKVVDRNLQGRAACGVEKRRRGKSRRPQMALRVVRCPYTLTGNPQEIRVQLAVGVLVVKNRHSVGPGRDALKLAGGMSVQDGGLVVS